MVQRVENSLAQMGVNTNECWQQGVCYVMENTKENISKGQASSWDKIVNSIIK